MKKALLHVLCLVLLTMTTGCFYLVRYDGPYRGKVVDMETRKPIESAVVLGTWVTETPTLAGGVSNYYDARETVTDKNGEFFILGHGLRVLSRLMPMRVLIFKAGYSYEQESWSSLKTGLYSKDRIKWEGDIPVFPLKKLTMDERRGYAMPSRPTIPLNKMRLMTLEINRERMARGMDVFNIGGQNE